MYFDHTHPSSNSSQIHSHTLPIQLYVFFVFHIEFIPLYYKVHHLVQLLCLWIISFTNTP